ncbi:MAG: hypothetical protein PHN37_02575 [Candidatus Pacebacteria bacterium]|nr:hypothetical protein [Candidatus Paceibacterota bacterium]
MAKRKPILMKCPHCGKSIKIILLPVKGNKVGDCPKCEIRFSVAK